MALTRKFLKAMGIEDEKIDQIIEAHSESVDALKQYKVDAEKLPEVQKELDALKAKSDDGLKKKYDDLKKKYDDLKAEYDKYKDDTEKEKTLSKKKELFKEVAKDAGLSEKGLAKALKYTDWEKVEIDDDGKVKNAKDHIKALKEEWAEYVTKEETKGAETSNPPHNDKNDNGTRTPSRAAEVAKKYYSNIYGIKDAKGESK